MSSSPVPYRQAFQTGQEGSAVDSCWLPVVVVRRLACEGYRHYPAVYQPD